MKKWIFGILLFAMVAGESSCIVREERRRRVPPPPPPPGHGVVVY